MGAPHHPHRLDEFLRALQMSLDLELPGMRRIIRPAEAEDVVEGGEPIAHPTNGKTTHGKSTSV